jgi:hypothetical protein
MPIGNRQARHTRRQVEASLTGCARVDHELLSNTGDELLVGVAIDQDIMPVKRRELPWSWAAELVSMADVDLDSPDRKNDLSLEIRVSNRVSVAINSVYWRDDA